MPIQSSDIKIYLSGGEENTNPNNSLGGAISTTEVEDDTIQNLFANVSASEGETGSVKYRAIFVKNTHATLTLQNTKVYLKSNTPSSDTHCQISVATESGSPIQTIANEDTAPTGQTFSDANGEENALTIGDLAPGAVKGLWVKRTVNAGASAYADDNIVITHKGSTEA